ncbi:MAG: RcnB family protein [Sphingomonas sp.]
MRKTIIMALMAAALLPATAQAQSREELRRDRQDIERQQRELNQAQRRGDPRDIRDERRDVRGARQEYREDLADRNRQFGRDDWRRYRDTRRDVFVRGSWNAPFRYHAFNRGVRIAPGYYATRYVIADPWRYHLPQPGRFQCWVRHYNDVVLVDTRRGIVIDAVRGFYL